MPSTDYRATSSKSASALRPRGEAAAWRRREVRALAEEIADSGELLGHVPLADPTNATTVRGDRTVTAAAGPFRSASEGHLAGCFVVDCDNVRRAVTIAARFPQARTCAVEVRPIMGMEM
ncbi:MAG: YciI family protein [Pseudonocardia sp.]|nr:YciI family protein [Pseudonocardia sp.]